VSTTYASRPAGLRKATPWHRLSHIVEALPARLQALSSELRVPDGGSVLDYGSADAPYRGFFAAETEFVTADLPGNPDASVEIEPDGTVPVQDGTFDAVLSTQVLEHVADPGLYLAECHRVLRPGGRLLLSTHGLMVYHPDPVDYWRWTGPGLEKAVRTAGFEIRRFEGIMGLAATGIQLVQDAVYWKLPRPLRPVFALISQTLVKVADRLQGPEGKRSNALVFALVAEKPRAFAGPRLLAAFADAHPEATFAEIGSNDGEQHDHLRPFILERGWRGVMVEPVPYIFERLRRNYEGVDRVALENCAIADRDGTLPFFHLVPREDMPRDDLPEWYDGIGSFSEASVLSHRSHIPDVDERIVRTEVPTLTFDSLCERHGFESIDLLVIDTEGYDAEILRTVDFHKHRPRLVVYEHYHLSAGDRHATTERLREAGYEILEEGFDTFCLLPGDPVLDELWRDLEPGVAGVAAYDEEGR
jgi:FkbM family methyltransferase